jgi:translocation and assembly module TamB
LHTNWGRGVAREQVEARLNEAFVGGASIGRLEGSVLGTMIVRDVVLNGPDGKPAVTVKKLTLGVGVLPLFSKQARIASLTAEDVDIDLRRDANGQLQIANMIRPGPKSGWAVQIPTLVVRRAHVKLHGANGAEDLDVDDLHISGRVHMPANEPLEAGAIVTATWRQRNAPIFVDANVINADDRLTIPSLIARLGDVNVVVAGGTLFKPALPSLAQPRPRKPSFAGIVSIDATKAAIAQLAPNVKLPVDDIDLIITAAPQPMQASTRLALRGTVDDEPVFGDIEARIEALEARGIIATGTRDLAKLTNGAVVGNANAVIVFDGGMRSVPAVSSAIPTGLPGPLSTGTLPAGNAMIHVAGDIAGVPDTTAMIAVASDGNRFATAITAATGKSTAQIGALVQRFEGGRMALEASRVIASVRDPSRATGGKAPVHGSLDVDVSASGALSPKPDLAITGRVIGSKLRAKDLSIRSLKLAVDARHVPSRPIGRGELEARDIVQGNIYLRELDMNAANRDDGKIAVTMRSKPRAAPWLVEADALVTPGETVTIDLLNHRVRAGSGAEWKGSSGQIVIGPRRIDVRDVSSASDLAALDLSGEVNRASGDLKLQLDVATFPLKNISAAYRGVANARITVSRERGRFSGVVDLDAKDVALLPEQPGFDGYAHVEVSADKLLVDANATSTIGKIGLGIDIDAPTDITNVVAWKKLHRHHIRSAQLTLEAVDIAKLASLAKLEGQYTGRIDGDIQLSSTTTGGMIQARGVNGPILKNLGPLSASLNIAQPSNDQLTPTLVATIDDRNAAGATVQKPLAKVEAQATLGIPGHLFDLDAWRTLGRRSFEGGAIRVEDVMIEPPLLDRLQVVTNLRGRASFVAELAPALENVKVALDVKQLRGQPIAQPVTLSVVGEIAGDTTAKLSLTNKTTKLLTVDATIPVSLAELRANPAAFRTAALKATATIPDVSAPILLETFGRTQIIDGKLSGTVDVAGTVEKPTVRARIAGTNLAVPPGPRNRPIKTVKSVTLDASWDGTQGKVAVDATQSDGSLSLIAEGNPKQLDAASVQLTAKSFDLMPLLVFAPGPAGGASGRLDAKLAMTGLDLRTSKIAGELHLTNGRVPIAPQVGTLRRAKIDVVVGPTTTVDIDARLGGGTVKGKASFVMQGAMPSRGSANLTLREVSPIGVVEPDVDADVTAELRRRPDSWVADIVVANGVVKVPKGRGQPLHPVGVPDDMVFVTGGDFEKAAAAKAKARNTDEEHQPVRPSLIANIEIRRTYVESEEVRGYIRGQLRVERDAEAIGIVGKVEADRGDLDLFGRRYQLDRAIVRFDGPPDPLLDIVISHDFPDVTTRTHVRGRLSKPELEMSSDPGTYSQGQLLGFLLGGEPSGQPADGNPRDQAAAAGASLVANKIGGYVREALPIDLDVLRYEAATSSSGAAITVGTWITRSLFIAYRRRIEARPDENAGEGEIEYWLARRLVVEGIVGDRGYNGVDLLWRKRY